MPPPYWAFAWAGGQALARYLLDNPQLVRGKHVLDLGAGSGLGAIAAMKAGAASGTAVDIDAFAAAAMAVNAKANDVQIDVTTDDPLGAAPGRHDVVLVGDLFYERTLAERVLAYIEAAAVAGALVLIGDPKRNYFPEGRFTKAVEYQVPVTRELEDALIKRTAVWRLETGPGLPRA